jgi:hypothetical protein
MKIFDRLRIIVIVLVLVVANIAILPKASAGTLTHSSILEIGTTGLANPMIASDAQELAVAFQPATASPTSGSLVFPAGFTINSSQTITGTGCTTYYPTATAIGGSPTASGSGQTISLASLTGITSTSTTYCFLLTNATAVTNTTAGVYSVTFNMGSDSQIDAIDVLSSGANAYSITGTVAPTFTMALSGSTDTFSGNLSASALVTSTGIGVTIGTNAATGWYVWAKDTNAGLKSTSNGHTIATVSTGSNHTMNGGTIGTEAYALGVDNFYQTYYQYSSGTAGGGLSSSAFNEIATNSSPSAGTSTTFTAHELADISATTPPGTDYTDTITLIGAGSF